MSNTIQLNIHYYSITGYLSLIDSKIAQFQLNCLSRTLKQPPSINPSLKIINDHITNERIASVWSPKLLTKLWQHHGNHSPSRPRSCKRSDTLFQKSLLLFLTWREYFYSQPTHFTSQPRKSGYKQSFSPFIRP